MSYHTILSELREVAYSELSLTSDANIRKVAGLLFEAYKKNSVDTVLIDTAISYGIADDYTRKILEGKKVDLPNIVNKGKPKVPRKFKTIKSDPLVVSVSSLAFSKDGKTLLFVMQKDPGCREYLDSLSAEEQEVLERIYVKEGSKFTFLKRKKISPESQEIAQKKYEERLSLYEETQRNNRLIKMNFHLAANIDDFRDKVKKYKALQKELGIDTAGETHEV